MKNNCTPKKVSLFVCMSLTPFDHNRLKRIAASCPKYD